MKCHLTRPRDVVLATKQKLSKSLRPELMSILRDNVAPLCTESLENIQLQQRSSLKTLGLMELPSETCEIKVQMENPSII